MQGNDFEQSIVKAKEKLEKLMDSEVTLGESVSLYKEGMQELKAAQELLEKAKIEYEEIKNSLAKPEEEA